jgi:hypothetical protein
LIPVGRVKAKDCSPHSLNKPASRRSLRSRAGATALFVLAALALFGFRIALAGRPALGKIALEE